MITSAHSQELPSVVEDMFKINVKQAAFNVGMQHRTIDFTVRENIQFLRNEIYKIASPLIVEAGKRLSSDQKVFERIIQDLTKNLFNYVPMSQIIEMAKEGQLAEIVETPRTSNTLSHKLRTFVQSLFHLSMVREIR